MAVLRLMFIVLMLVTYIRAIALRLPHQSL
jgi:hypothetical protein